MEISVGADVSCRLGTRCCRGRVMAEHKAGWLVEFSRLNGAEVKGTAVQWKRYPILISAVELLAEV